MQTLRTDQARAKTVRKPHLGESVVLVAGLMLTSACEGGNAPITPSPSSSVTSSVANNNSMISNGNGCPRMMARIESYCIDRYEAHVVELDSDHSWRPHPHYLRVEGIRVMAKTAPGVFPQGYMTQIESENACLEAGKRLCTVKEWLQACLGPDNLTYSYGNDEQPGKCNTMKVHLLSVLHGTDNNEWTLEDFNDPALDTTPGFLEKTGSNAQCVSGYGVHDMVGNLAEWTNGKVTEADISAMKPGTQASHMTVVGNGIFMGSFYANSNENGSGCHYNTKAHEPTYHDYSTGFRCCADAKK